MRRALCGRSGTQRGLLVWRSAWVAVTDGEGESSRLLWAGSWTHIDQHPAHNSIGCALLADRDGIRIPNGHKLQSYFSLKARGVAVAPGLPTASPSPTK